ncbi:hypothetical protein H4R34_003283 [Dimargaris verticillata]|uniref:Uncharacterized protein n=1 Tax=Dimargaris verticillata TaxID=2761393 RepID=A0A9W8B6D3_9FUNG|nr:hypothetical protein H4R34_003283 [Dimargaris verticillata]
MKEFSTITVFALVVATIRLAGGAPTTATPTQTDLTPSRYQPLHYSPVVQNRDYSNLNGSSPGLYESDTESVDGSVNMASAQPPAESMVLDPRNFGTPSYSHAFANKFQLYHDPRAFVQDLIEAYVAQGSPGTFPIDEYLYFFQQQFQRGTTQYQDPAVAYIAIGPLYAYLEGLKLNCIEGDNGAHAFLMKAQQIIGVPMIRSGIVAFKALEQELSKRSVRTGRVAALQESIAALGILPNDIPNDEAEKYASHMVKGNLDWDNASDLIIDLFNVAGTILKENADKTILNAP